MPSSLGPAEILVILVVALIVLGPKRLPEAGRQVGKALSEIRRWTQDMKSEVTSAFDADQASAPPAAPVTAPDVIVHTPAVAPPPQIVEQTAVTEPAPLPEPAPEPAPDRVDRVEGAGEPPGADEARTEVPPSL